MAISFTSSMMIISVVDVVAAVDVVVSVDVVVKVAVAKVNRIMAKMVLMTTKTTNMVKKKIMMIMNNAPVLFSLGVMIFIGVAKAEAEKASTVGALATKARTMPTFAEKAKARKAKAAEKVIRAGGARIAVRTTTALRRWS